MDRTVSMLTSGTETDIQLKTFMRSVEVFNMKINMRRDSMIFYSENHRIDNTVRWCLFI